MKIELGRWMSETGVPFGTSGARGLATQLTDQVAYVYTRAFLQFVRASAGPLDPGSRVAVAGDLRPSTGRIMKAIFRSITDAGYRPVNCGTIPSPAVACFGLEHRIPAIMVTGSHIPDDRNGIKFNKPSGEVLKDDEAAIRAQEVELAPGLFDRCGAGIEFATGPVPTEDPAALQSYRHRYCASATRTLLSGVRLGVYQHSAVGRDVLLEILEALGARVTALGRSDRFVPVDTEAIRPEDTALAREWAGSGRFDAIVSTDGDSDRPLISDERGEWLRGDVAGMLCARFLDADSVSVPVSCTTAIEKSGWFTEVRRTRIGSPYVVASLLAATAAGRRRVAGFEANGGFLLNSEVTLEGHRLPPLPTRDAVIVLVGVLGLACRLRCPVSELVGQLPARFTASDRLQEIPVEDSRRFLTQFDAADPESARRRLTNLFGPLAGSAAAVDWTDGVRATFTSGEIIHLRPSGNAPEFRCYTEAATQARASELIQHSLEIVRSALSR